MLTRLRYKTNEQTGNLHSKALLAGTRFIVVTIIPSSLTFLITDYNTSEVLLQQTAPTLNKLKAAAKGAVEDMGVVFQDEVRQKSTPPAESSTTAA
jgi:hypothetical protein